MNLLYLLILLHSDENEYLSHGTCDVPNTTDAIYDVPNTIDVITIYLISMMYS